jgi:hypothetical protein
VNREVQMKDASVLADGRTVDEALRKVLSTFTDCSGDSIELVSKQTHLVCFGWETHYASSRSKNLKSARLRTTAQWS